MIYKSVPTALRLLLAATLAAAPLAIAQTSQPAAPDMQPSASQPAAASARTPNPHRQALRMARELNLTSDQTSAIEPILAGRDQKIAALRADSSLAPKAAKQQIHAIQQSTRSQLSSVLTPDQLNQLKSVQHAHSHSGQAQPATTPTA